MTKAKPLINQDGVQQGYVIECPGCGFWHFFNVEQPGAHGQKWSFNGNLERPTFTPSMVVRTGHFATGDTEAECKKCRSCKERGKRSHCVRCHSFVTDGRIQFLGDSSHALAGQTVELPEVDDD